MSKPISISNWLLQYLLKETAEKLPEDACSNTKASFPDTQLVKVIQVLLSSCERYYNTVTVAVGSQLLAGVKHLCCHGSCNLVL